MLDSYETQFLGVCISNFSRGTRLKRNTVPFAKTNATGSQNFHVKVKMPSNAKSD